MIKLSGIINEIKLFGKITPKMVDELDSKIIRGASANLHNKTVDLYIKKYGYRTHISWDDWLADQTPKTLEQIYNDLLELEKEKNVSK